MFLADFFAQLWRLYNLEIPFLWEGATAGQFVLGFFVVLVSVKIIHQLFIENTK